MGLFTTLTTEGLEKTEDRLGGTRVVESNIYLATIKMAYAGKAASSNAQSITLVMDLGNKQEYRETLWITNRNGENFFRNRHDDTKKVPLPGFVIIDDLCSVTTDKPLSQQDVEEKTVKIYDFEERKEVPTSVPMLVDLLGKQAYFAVTKEIVNKNKKNDSTGEYEATAETREENVTQKVFHHPTKLTMVEAREGLTEPTFFDTWSEKNKDKTRDRRTIKEGESAQGGKSGPPQAGASGAKKTSSLFSQ